MDKLFPIIRRPRRPLSESVQTTAALPVVENIVMVEPAANVPPVVEPPVAKLAPTPPKKKTNVVPAEN